MRKVVVESPYGGNFEGNVQYARRCLRDCLMRGESPIASHLLLTQPGVLRDDVAEERSHGIAAGHVWIGVCDAVVIYEDLGISKGMQQAIDLAERTGKLIERRRIL